MFSIKIPSPLKRLIRSLQFSGQSSFQNLRTHKLRPKMASLLGPPELRTPAPQSQPQPQQASESKADPFMDLMVANFNKASLATTPPMGFTENGSATFLSSGNPCLDFFFHVVPDTPPHDLTQRLVAAWAHHPVTSLKLICNLRGVRGTGKSDKKASTRLRFGYTLSTPRP